MSDWVHLPKPYECISIIEGCDLEGPAAYELGPGLYVGGTSNMRARLGDHRRAGMLSVIRSGSIYSCATTDAALRLEKSLIWLENPSENLDRPKPTGPLLAATIGRPRPLDGWAWFPECGHVGLNGITLADSLDILYAGCQCKPWDDWLDAIHSQALEIEQRERQALQERSEIDSDAPCAECEVHEQRVAKLERLLVKAQEAEWTA